jgi:nucleoside-diphosphate-sugar epimerase
MNIFIAGGSGTIGVPLIRQLVNSGHRVTALTRSESRRADLGALGAQVCVADALDRQALLAGVVAARPTHVIHELTALPKAGAQRERDLEPTNRLRIEGTRNLLEAAVAAGARRFLAGSFAMLAPGIVPPQLSRSSAAAAIESMETQVLDATKRGVIEGVILRYGLFYGPEAPSTRAMIDLVRKHRLPVIRHDSSQLPVIHIDDAAQATVSALDTAPAGAVYEIVDDRLVSFSEIVQAIAARVGAPAPFGVPSWIPRLLSPYMGRLIGMRLALSNARARADLHWEPRHPTIREGLAETLHQAA